MGIHLLIDVQLEYIFVTLLRREHACVLEEFAHW